MLVNNVNGFLERNKNTINNMVQYQSTQIDMAGSKVISKYP